MQLALLHGEQVLIGLLFSIGFILTLPWSAVTSFIVAKLSPGLGDRPFALVLVVFAGVNAVILYFIAVKIRRLIK